MSHQRSDERMARAAGPAVRRHGRPGGSPAGVAEKIFESLAAFSSFGFPESHALSFAYLVYSSAWFKLHYPAAFTAGLLNAQPMGFWSPQSLVADAKRHGVVVLRPDVNASRAGASPAVVDRRAGRGPEPARPGGPGGAPGAGLRAVGGTGDGRASGRRAALGQSGGPGPPGWADPSAARSAGPGRRPRRPVRRPGPVPAAGLGVDGRGGGPGHRRPPARGGDRGGGPAAARPRLRWRRSPTTCGRSG